MIIISYRQNYGYGRHGGPYRHCDSEFQISSAETEEDAAKVIAKFTIEDMEAETEHVVCRNWHDLENAVGRDHEYGRTCRIYVGGSSWIDEDPEVEALETRLRNAVAALIDVHTTTEKARVEMEKANQKAQELLKREAQDRAEYERLRKRFEK